MRICTFALISLFLFASPLEGQQSGRGEARGGSGGGPGAGQSGRFGGRRPIDDVDWTRVMQFFQDYSPSRYRSFLTLNEEQQRRLRGEMLYRYRSIDWLRREKQERLVEIKLDELRYEDGVFQNKQDLQRIGVDDEEAEPIKRQLKNNLRKLIELRLEERDLRLKRLKELVVMEEEKLLKDRNELEALLKNRYEEELKCKTEDDRGHRGEDADKWSGQAR